MASKKANKGSPAPTASKKPVAVRKDGLPTRAEKSAVHKVTKAAAFRQVHAQIEVHAPPVADVTNRPSVYTDALGDVLFDLVATGHSLDKITSREDMPKLSVLLRWLGDDTHPFKTAFARAKLLLVPLFEERIQQVGLESNPQTIKIFKQHVTKDGDVIDIEEERILDNVDRSRLAVQTYQWTLSHLKPKKHGRTPDQSSGTANEQLKGLFDALKAGPVD